MANRTWNTLKALLDTRYPTVNAVTAPANDRMVNASVRVFVDYPSGV